MEVTNHLFVNPDNTREWYVCLVTQWCPTLCDPMDCSLPGSSVHRDSPGNTGVGCHTLLQGILPTQGSNPGLLHFRQTLYQVREQYTEGKKLVYLFLYHNLVIRILISLIKVKTLISSTLATYYPITEREKIPVGYLSFTIHCVHRKLNKPSSP